MGPLQSASTLDEEFQNLEMGQARSRGCHVTELAGHLIPCCFVAARITHREEVPCSSVTPTTLYPE
jgi:hypothetical protein